MKTTWYLDKDLTLKVKDELVKWIRDWFSANGPGCNAILGMSGGKDSTIAAALIAEAIGADKVIGVAIPDKGQGENGAKEICEHLGIKYLVFPIENITGGFYGQLPNGQTLSVQAQQNIPPRIRMTVLYALGQTFNARPCCTCNLSESYIGYETLFGDDAGSFAPLDMLTVTEVLAIGDAMGIPYEWVHKVPDDGLPHSCPDEEKFGFSYATLDKYIRGLEEPDSETKAKIDRMHLNNLFKHKILHVPAFDPFYEPEGNTRLTDYADMD